MSKVYKTINDLPKEENFEGFVSLQECNWIKNKSFEKEKDLVQYIVNNIDSFAKDLLDDTVIAYEVDKPLSKRYGLSPSVRRVDLFIIGKKKKYIIEAKNPSSATENRGAIGQVLDYGREFPDSEKELIIITSLFDIETARTIAYYNLPIRYIYLSKGSTLEYKEES